MQVGERYGRWVVISLDAPRYRGHAQVRVRCDCGTERVIPSIALTRSERPSRQCQRCARKLVARQRFGTRRLPDYD